MRPHNRALFVGTAICLVIIGPKASGAQSALETDWRALVALYDATNGPGWNRNDNWSSSIASVPSEEELGAWFGVTIADGRVTGLDLSVNALSGRIPPELGAISELKELVLRFNSLTGEIPPELGNLRRLELLSLNHNNLVGDVPHDLGNLSELIYLLLGGNALTGSIPPVLGDLSKLEYLRLGENALTGSIPPALASLSRLRTLELDKNDLSGAIPAELGNLSQLIDLYLGQNELEGEIPPELGNLSQLEILELGTNALTGSIPPELGKLTRLLALQLGQNALTGSIPPELGNLALLDDLWLPVNALSGALPPELGRLTKLRRLDVRTNQLTGTIPPELGNLGQLEWLMLSFNNLTGPIPHELGNLPQLRRLSVRYNNLSGPLPMGLTRLTRLEQLATNHNSLCVPFEESFQVWLASVRNVDFLSSVQCAVSTVDLQALVKVYNATGGPDWTRNHNWSATAPVLTETQLNEWYGVTVSDRRVTALVLPANEMEGALPPELGNLSQLSRLHLNRNALQGSIPPELGHLAQLEHLQLDRNALSGEIPAELGSLPKLLRLHLDHNALTGNIPLALADLSELTWLTLEHNALSGELPAELGSLSQLKRLNLDNNALSGQIPPELGELSELLWLRLSHNSLSGDIPPELGRISQLEWLDVSRNGFGGELPRTLTQLGRLGYLFFQENDGLCAPSDAAFQGWLNNVFAHLGPNCQSSITLVLERNQIDEGDGAYVVTLTGVLSEPATRRTQVPLHLATASLPYSYDSVSSAPTVLEIPAGDLRGLSSFALRAKTGSEPKEYQMATLTASTALQGIRIDPSTMNITAIGTNALLWHAPVENQVYSEDRPIPALTLPEVTNGKAPVTYTLHPELPHGLFFGAEDRKVSGTPTVARSRTSYTYSATDAAGYNIATKFTIEVVAAPDAEIPALPTQFVLQGNYPNPFSESTRIEFDLPQNAQVTVEVFNLLGHRVASLPTVRVERGWQRRIEVSGTGLPSGVYLYRLLIRSGPHKLVRSSRMTLIR